MIYARYMRYQTHTSKRLRSYTNYYNLFKIFIQIYIFLLCKFLLNIKYMMTMYIWHIFNINIYLIVYIYVTYICSIYKSDYKDFSNRRCAKNSTNLVLSYIYANWIVHLMRRFYRIRYELLRLLSTNLASLRCRLQFECRKATDIAVTRWFLAPAFARSGDYT